MLHTIVFAGPSAVGKTYIAEQLILAYPKQFEQAKLYTTRKPRSGEVNADRIFVDKQTFNSLVKDGSFVVHAEFGGNWYGFTEESLHPKTKHLLVNAWPWLIPQFAKLNHVVIIGMQAPDSWERMLIDRMKARGDTKETIQKRLLLINKDIQDLQQNTSLVASHGKYFIVENNQTIPKTIVPWIEKFLNLDRYTVD